VARLGEKNKWEMVRKIEEKIDLVYLNYLMEVYKAKDKKLRVFVFIPFFYFYFYGMLWF
jgi:hypothetical protein